MINNFFDKLFVVSRASWTADEDDNPCSTETEVGQFMGHIQEASATLVSNLGMNLTKPFAIWCGIDEDVKAGDTLQSVDGRYSVKGTQRFDIGGNKHLQLVVQEDEIIGS
jgi:hypothetical protein